MKGNNTLNLNEATMIEAVQLYLDSKMIPGQSPTVSSVTMSRDGGSNIFTVRVAEREAARKEA